MEEWALKTSFPRFGGSVSPYKLFSWSRFWTETLLSGGSFHRKRSVDEFQVIGKKIRSFGKFKYFFKNGPSPASFSFIFGLFQTNINTILQQIYVKNVHPVYSTRIRTHDRQDVSH